MELAIKFYYWHEVMGPLLTFTKGKFEIKDEELLILLSTVEPYIITTESTISGPAYLGKKTIMTYNRCVNNPEAQDERICLLGADCWVLIVCPVELEIVLLSKIDLVKEILDIEFEAIEEVNQLDSIMGERADYAIRNVYLE
ncbi:MAG: hypothetical protein JXA54_00705 [Candidatus Heimdallarchaeota archaeon]|nr:hypothetical protein [Candidatus Heimdallarchaeota archaeon]